MTIEKKPEQMVTRLGEFVNRVGDLRNEWMRENHQELWYRGEARKYGSFLSPELYRARPECPPRSMKKIQELLTIEYELYQAFRRGAVQLSSERHEDDNWDWDSYFLMQHHNAPTRLLDWSDGALVALHFAVRDRSHDKCDAIVYVMEPDGVKNSINSMIETKKSEWNWKKYVDYHPDEELSNDEWERLYLPRDFDTNFPIPSAPLLLEFPHITRRVAAQRSRFMVFGSSPAWLATKSEEPDFPMRKIVVSGSAKASLRTELRDMGVTESVVFPDLDGLGREMKQIWEDRR